jgi:hypothetical protein
VRFSRTSRWKLTSSSLFAKRGCRLACFGTQHCALLIVPPIVSGATRRSKRQFLAHVALEADVVGRVGIARSVGCSRWA